MSVIEMAIGKETRFFLRIDGSSSIRHCHTIAMCLLVTMASLWISVLVDPSQSSPVVLLWKFLGSNDVNGFLVCEFWISTRII